jgi:hypothetical protein
MAELKHCSDIVTSGIANVHSGCMAETDGEKNKMKVDRLCRKLK